MITSIPHIKNENTIVRKMYPKDVSIFRQYRSDVQLGRFQGWSGMSETEAVNFVSTMSSLTTTPLNEWFQLTIADSCNDEIIGDIGICISTENFSAEIGYTICNHAQNKGHAKKAVKLVVQWLSECCNVKKFFGISDSRNLPSIRVLLAVGFTIEKEYETYFNGERCTEVLFTMEL